MTEPLISAIHGPDKLWSIRQISHSLLGPEDGTFRRAIVLVVCILGAMQYGMVLVFGTTAAALEAFYGLTHADSDFLYACLNFGASALSFIPGVLYDRFGPSATMAVGTVMGAAPILFQIGGSHGFPPWSYSMPSLTLCYIVFGLSSAFFNVVGSLAPLTAFEERHIGKASAVVQVCLSLGISVQSMAFLFFSAEGNDFEGYQRYTLTFTTGGGIVMCFVFWACDGLVRTPRQLKGGNSSLPEDPLTAAFMWQRMCSLDFACMTLVFALGIGFCFNFLEEAPRIAVAAGADADSLSVSFGLLSALGRVATSVPLDYTRRWRFGAPYIYLAGSQFVLAAGLACIIFGESLGWSPARTAFAANAFVALGYGGTLGIVPPAIRLLFGSHGLGTIYGLLYTFVAVAEPAWSLASPRNCETGLSCFRGYCVAGMTGASLVAAACATMLARGGALPGTAKQRLEQ